MLCVTYPFLRWVCVVIFLPFSFFLFFYAFGFIFIFKLLCIFFFEIHKKNTKFFNKKKKTQKFFFTTILHLSWLFRICIFEHILIIIITHDSHEGFFRLLSKLVASTNMLCQKLYMVFCFNGR